MNSHSFDELRRNFAGMTKRGARQRAFSSGILHESFSHRTEPFDNAQDKLRVSDRGDVLCLASLASRRAERRVAILTHEEVQLTAKTIA